VGISLLLLMDRIRRKGLLFLLHNVGNLPRFVQVPLGLLKRDAVPVAGPRTTAACLACLGTQLRGWCPRLRQVVVKHIPVMLNDVP
jgi:hypothetical protein